MIRLTVNGIARVIPNIYEMTVKEYRTFVQSETMTIVDYICATLDITGEVAANISLKDVVRIEIRLGEFINPFEENAHLKTESSRSFMSRNKLDSAKLDKVGHRILFESKSKTTQDPIELSLFCLSMAITPSIFDFEKINQNAKMFENSSYVEVLPVAAFFLRKLIQNSSKEVNLFRKFLTDIRTKIFLLRTVPASIRSANILRLMKFREFVMLLMYRLTRHTR